MVNCPHCHTELNLRKVPHPGFTPDYRVCPNCKNKFTVDRQTKRRQKILLPITLVSLVFTLLAYFGNTWWWIPATISYFLIGIFIYWANGKVVMVPYNE